ncbi:MAG TPA: hypothetical protein PLC48_00155 [Ferruginibacter sp.]|nr:hypothetical protein [Ferruginibacter sp.]
MKKIAILFLLSIWGFTGDSGTVVCSTSLGSIGNRVEKKVQTIQRPAAIEGEQWVLETRFKM